MAISYLLNNKSFINYYIIYQLMYYLSIIKLFIKD